MLTDEQLDEMKEHLGEWTAVNFNSDNELKDFADLCDDPTSVLPAPWGLVFKDIHSLLVRQSIVLELIYGELMAARHRSANEQSPQLVKHRP